MFNSSGVCFLEKQIEILFSDKEEYNNYKIKIKRIGHLFYQYQQKINESTKNKNREAYINQIENNSDNDYIFNSIETSLYKILILMKKDIILIGTFPKSCSRQFQKLLLTHIFIGVNNFKGDISTIIKKFNEIETYNDNNFIHIKSFYNNKESLSTKESNDILEILIFDNIFLKTLIVHFQKVFYHVFKKEDLNLKQTKLKNLYIIDLNNANVLIDMNKIQGIKSHQQNKKFYKCEKLFEEIIYQSKTMYNNYIKEYNFKYTSADSDYRFVKFECTSTYPRLLFIIRFVPVLKGLAIIHVYSQKKLSRNNDNNIQSEQGINCKEVDFIFGSFIKGNRNFEFKYGAPEKLKYIEKFMEEFFLTGRSGLNIFKTYNQNKKYKYVNYDIIKIINSFQITKNMGVEEIFQNFLNKLKEQHEKDEIEKKGKEQEMNENNSNESEEEIDDTKKIDKLFSLNKETFYNVLLNINPSKAPQQNKENKSIHLITDGEVNNKNNMIQNNLIVNIVNINSERQNLLEGNSLMFSENNEKTNSVKDQQRFENTSKISEVIVKEKFEMRISNIKKNKQEENKEVTNDKISNNTLNEKEKNLNDILELISSNSKIIENKKFVENSKENESKLNPSNKSKNKNKLPLIDVSQ